MLDLWYQRAPKALTGESIYRESQAAHDFDSFAPLRPDLVLRRATDGNESWCLVEGTKRHLKESARETLKDLLAYRTAFEEQLRNSTGPYGLGLAWSTDTQPADGEILLCTPDRISDALTILLG